MSWTSHARSAYRVGKSPSQIGLILHRESWPLLTQPARALIMSRGTGMDAAEDMNTFFRRRYLETLYLSDVGQNPTGMMPATTDLHRCSRR